MLFQAHKGVESECPENTFAAFKRAVCQGYDVIELDLAATKDKKIVVVHDSSINRCARNSDGSEIEKEIQVSQSTYNELLHYDFGIWFDKKYKGEKIPLFSDVLRYAKENGVRLKIDNKFEKFSHEELSVFYDLINDYRDCISLTSQNVGRIKDYISRFPNISIDYDGKITEESLGELKNSVPKGKLTVWLPFECENTSWVTVDYISQALCDLVKQYANLGVWGMEKAEDFDFVKKTYSPYIIETNGNIKP